jgi:hypothetical protein
MAMIAGILGLWLQIQGGGVQASVAVQPETVTVGQHFVATVRVRAPRGSTIEFPVGTGTPSTVDTAAATRRRDTTTADGVEATSAYVLAAWDTGTVTLGLGDVVIHTPAGDQRVSLSGTSVSVRSVLPADTALRVPKPPRPVIQVTPFNWLPWIIAAIVAALLGFAAWLWAWFRRRAQRPVTPLTWAEREFQRIEAMHLLDAGQGERHAILMTGVLRTYLDRRFATLGPSATTRELAGRLRTVSVVPYDRTVGVLERVDLLKFARQTVSRDQALAIGTESRALVQQIETRVREAELATKTSGNVTPDVGARAA